MAMVCKFLITGRDTMNISKSLLTLLMIAVLAGCSTGIDPALQEQIDYKSYSTEELFEHYEDLNEELVDVIEEKNYYYKKLIKVKAAFRVLKQRIDSRQKRISEIQSPVVKEGEPAPVINEDKINSYRESIAEYEEEIAAIQTEIDEYTALTKKFTDTAIKLRVNRNKAYDAYINSREELKALNMKAEEQLKQ